MSLDELEELYSGVRRSATAETFAPEALARLAIGLRIDDDDLARIPKTGPAIFVSNHPSGLLDGLLLDTAILRVRSDVKILANALLSAIPEIHSRLLPLDVLQNRDRRRNVRSMRAAVRHLQNGGAVVMFPAGEVSHIQFREFRISDPEWDDSVARLVRAKGATVIPVHVSASNSLAFQIASLMHPGLRTVRLAAELLNKRGRTVRIAVGSPIPGATVRALPSEQSAKEYLRGGTYMLAYRSAARQQQERTGTLSTGRPSDDVRREVAAIAERGGVVLESGKYQVLFAPGRRLGPLLNEVGRLRELAFRHVGEGTGREIDLDIYDRSYYHLVLWDASAEAVAGAYRMTWTSDVLSTLGLTGLYTNTLFRYSRHFFDLLGPAVELGRSFLTPDYQRDFAPLLLLWQGLARCVGARPDAPALFGAVSVSGCYSAASRDLIHGFLHERCLNRDLRRYVSPRHPYRAGTVHASDLEAILRGTNEVESLAAPLRDIGDHAGVPVLLRQYLKLGGQIAATNVDENFSDVLDALIVVDLRKTEPRPLDRYMGKDLAESFRQRHRQ